MKALSIREHFEDAYIITVIAILGIFAFISAVLISWPALAYLISKIIF